MFFKNFFVFLFSHEADRPEPSHRTQLRIIDGYIYPSEGNSSPVRSSAFSWGSLRSPRRSPRGLRSPPLRSPRPPPRVTKGAATKSTASTRAARPFFSRSFNPCLSLFLLFDAGATLALGFFWSCFFCFRYSSKVIVFSSGSGAGFASSGLSSVFPSASSEVFSTTGSVCAFKSSSGVPQLPAPAPCRLSSPL